MERAVQGLQDGLGQVLLTLASTVAEIATLIQHQDHQGSTDMSGSTNTFGDEQLKLDMAVDDLVFSRLAGCSACCAASSEERPEMRELDGQGYTVVFDPLDGSSIVGANFAVGTIFGVWPGKGVLNRTGREQVAAAYAVYGPRTLLVWARPRVASERTQEGPPPAVTSGLSQSQGTGPSEVQQAGSLSVLSGGPQNQYTVQQFILSPQGQWSEVMVPGQASVSHEKEGGGPDAKSSMNQPPISHPCLISTPRKLFAPANLRSAAENTTYAELVAKWIAEGFTLRYTGGMVPDVHHIIAKGGGVFVNPTSANSPPKLRLVYECAPLALIIEAAGGRSDDGHGSILDIPITSTQQRVAIVLGSHNLVEDSMLAMKASYF